MTKYLNDLLEGTSIESEREVRSALVHPELNHYAQAQEDFDKLSRESLVQKLYRSLSLPQELVLTIYDALPLTLLRRVIRGVITVPRFPRDVILSLPAEARLYFFASIWKAPMPPDLLQEGSLADIVDYHARRGETEFFRVKGWRSKYGGKITRMRALPPKSPEPAHNIIPINRVDRLWAVLDLAHKKRDESLFDATCERIAVAIQDEPSTSWRSLKLARKIRAMYPRQKSVAVTQF